MVWRNKPVSVASSDASAVGIATTSKIEIRIGKVLGNNVIADNTANFTVNDNIEIKSLGANASGVLDNSWFTNVSPKYDVKSLSLIDDSSFTYSIVTFANNNLRIGDKAIVIQSNGVEKEGVVLDITSANTFTFSRAGELEGSTFSVRRGILKPDVASLNFDDYSYIEKSFANVQNVYSNYDGDVLVASPSIPFYHDTPLNFYDRKVKLDGEYSGELFSLTREHGFHTGDRVYYEDYTYDTEYAQIVKSKFPEIKSWCILCKAS